MTGIELTAVWLFGIFCGSVAACSVARSWALARKESAKALAEAHVEAYRIAAQVRAQAGRPLTVPEPWTLGGEL